MTELLKLYIKLSKLSHYGVNLFDSLYLIICEYSEDNLWNCPYIKSGTKLGAFCESIDDFLSGNDHCKTVFFHWICREKYPIEFNPRKNYCR